MKIGVQSFCHVVEERARNAAVVANIHVPDMNYVALAHALHRMAPKLPVIVACGRLDDHMAEELKEVGVVKILNKPFTQAALAKALAEVLSEPR